MKAPRYKPRNAGLRVCTSERMTKYEVDRRTVPKTTRTEAEQDDDLIDPREPTRVPGRFCTEAEQAVLDAMAAAVIRSPNGAGRRLRVEDEAAVCRAELARRGLK